jgi:O-methyltransferase
MGSLSRTVTRELAWARIRVAHRTEYDLMRKYADDTMVPRAKFVDNLLLCGSVSVDGAVVEAGCWRGGMSAAMAETMPARRLDLFDSFEGLPDAGALDGPTAHEWIATGRTLRAPEDAARAAMRRSGHANYVIHHGWFADTVPAYAATAPRIAVLRLDGDWYDSTMVCLEQLFPHVVDGGLVIVDDYGHWEGCTRAVHDYLARGQRSEPIQHTRYGVAYLEKGTGYATVR